jgi:hypothetical protein
MQFNAPGQTFKGGDGVANPAKLELVDGAIVMTVTTKHGTMINTYRYE